MGKKTQLGETQRKDEKIGKQDIKFKIQNSRLVFNIFYYFNFVWLSSFILYHVSIVVEKGYNRPAPKSNCDTDMNQIVSSYIQNGKPTQAWRSRSQDRDPPRRCPLAISYDERSRVRQRHATLEQESCTTSAKNEVKSLESDFGVVLIVV